MKKKTTNYALELALAAGATTTKDQNRPKAKRICVGIDFAIVRFVPGISLSDFEDELQTSRASTPASWERIAV